MTRLAIKTATYSAMHMAVAILVAYALSGSWAIALGIGIVEPLVQTVAYNFHEWAWSRAPAGSRQSTPPVALGPPDAHAV